MKRSLYVSLLTFMYFSACQGSEELEQSQEKEYTVSIMARIGKTVSGARYLQDHENAIASFSKTDDIGVFMDNDSAVRWIFDGTSWTTEKSVFWKDKNQEHTFYAYYPHSGSKATPVVNGKIYRSNDGKSDIGIWAFTKENFTHLSQDQKAKGPRHSKVWMVSSLRPDLVNAVSRVNL